MTLIRLNKPHHCAKRVWDVAPSLCIFGDPGADSGARENRKGQKKWATRSLFLPLSTFPRPTICPWVSGDAVFVVHPVNIHSPMGRVGEMILEMQNFGFIN